MALQMVGGQLRNQPKDQGFAWLLNQHACEQSSESDSPAH